MGSNTIGNVPLVVLLLQILPAPDPDLLYFLALVSTLAGNLLIVGSLANIITVERASEVGVELGFLEHARCGVPITVLSLAAAVAWLAFGAGRRSRRPCRLRHVGTRGQRRFAHSHWSGPAAIQRANSSLTRAVMRAPPPRRRARARPRPGDGP